MHSKTEILKLKNKWIDASKQATSMSAEVLSDAEKLEGQITEDLIKKEQTLKDLNAVAFNSRDKYHKACSDNFNEKKSQTSDETELAVLEEVFAAKTRNKDDWDDAMESLGLW